jgi:EpsI family protein
VAPECEDCAYRLLPSVKGQIPFELNGADATATMLYRDGGQRFSVFAAAFMPDRRGHRMVQGPYRTLRDDWLVFAGAPVSDQIAGGITYAEAVVWRGAERQLVWRAYLIGGRFVSAGGRAVKLELGLARLLGRPADGATIIVATSMEDGMDAARAALEKFLSTFPPDRFLWRQLTDKKDGAVCAE